MRARSAAEVGYRSGRCNHVRELTGGPLDQAAAGRSNQQIADDMHLSVRTVGNHLQRAYEKLGVSGRQELAGALQEQSGAQPPNS